MKIKLQSPNQLTHAVWAPVSLAAPRLFKFLHTMMPAARKEKCVCFNFQVIPVEKKLELL